MKEVSKIQRRVDQSEYSLDKMLRKTSEFDKIQQEIK